MSFKSHDTTFTFKATKHFQKFIEEYSLFNKEEPLLIAVSAGVDSMVLGFLVHELKRCGYSNKLTFIYINHNTRSGQQDEQALVENYAKHLGVNFLTFTLEGLNPDQNFEHTARKARYAKMLEQLKPNEKILFAHHIDDSYEWSILQGLRSSNMKSTLGIPVINGQIRRPLMCFTKTQIKKIAKAYDLPFLKDPTNEQVKYERNFLRHKIIKSFAVRYPKYLKHYVNQHNEMARVLGLHAYQKAQSGFIQQKVGSTIHITHEASTIQTQGLESEILKALKNLDPHVRGNIHGQMDKIKMALTNNKFGPLTLSGGVNLYFDFNHLIMVKKSEIQKTKVKSIDVELTLSQFKNYLSHKNEFLILAQFLNHDRDFVFPKRVHPYLAIILDRNKLDNMRYLTRMNLFKQWSRPKNLNKRLKLRLFLAY
jgi:tRNA(Ile)-lysidine synthase